MMELYILCTTLFEYDQQFLYPWRGHDVRDSGIVCKMMKVQNQKAHNNFQLKLNQTAHSEVC